MPLKLLLFSRPMCANQASRKAFMKKLKQHWRSIRLVQYFKAGVRAMIPATLISALLFFALGLRPVAASNDLAACGGAYSDCTGWCNRHASAENPLDICRNRCWGRLDACLFLAGKFIYSQSPPSPTDEKPSVPGQYSRTRSGSR